MKLLVTTVQLIEGERKIIFFAKNLCLNYLRCQTVKRIHGGTIICFVQHTNDFALYTEAIKFFNHSETMVRIAVRTITLNVYRGEKLLTHTLSYQLNVLWYLLSD